MGVGCARLAGGLTMRSYAEGPQWEWLRKRTLELILAKVGSLEQLEKEAFRMAAGGERGCTLASDPELHRQLRELWKDLTGSRSLATGGQSSASL